jgi:hypothetical protein
MPKATDHELNINSIKNTRHFMYSQRNESLQKAKKTEKKEKAKSGNL